ncbi:O-methyltransferase [Riemerella anatipestifer]|uniref:Putative O-methyltransferase n=1 Tax=Riemerella anatipestifer RA-CH-1 TaxID=1228997 RepID=J9QSV3_RIEAN|nr:O-methyltransferase [Riemerella anatipestifer]AFR35131.1 putative O-methyltransferase [Riemerella anatipestifer RA-CH-1]AIH02149.1 caffeoyl-CoA o-methyltransferase [Riemerella anatipestifer CH3]MCO7332202.1 O-methyltransferase [Riemerella anatipestifer]MCO7350965.1 O-methyltransferase [Riemerella anatipestifer]MCU7581840.1 O-methyltransferase [Riemerella anatipestifer]
MGFFEEQCPEMDRYLELHTSSEPEILRKLRRETYQKTTQPHMISGVQQGRLLSIISQLLRPKSVLEIGTFTGYATLSMAEGLPDEGKITTLDINEDLAYIPKKYFEESIYFGKIDFRLENALDYLNSTQEMFDMVFVDADKGNYVNYFNAVKDRLNSGGVLMFDNVLWYGKVLEENSKDKSTQVIKELNEILAKDPDFENLILPLRDGLNLARKK